MNEKRELERHNKIIEQINKAKTREDLPRLSYAAIASFFSSNIYFNDEKISASEYTDLVDKIVKHSTFNNQEVKEYFIGTIIEKYPNTTEEEIIQKYEKILNTNRVDYILNEIGFRNIKLDKIIKEENLSIHNDIMKNIYNSYEIKDLPKVGIGELNRKLLRAVNDNDYIRTIKTSEIKELTDAYLDENNNYQIDEIIKKICSKYTNLSKQENDLMVIQILNSLKEDETIEYTKEEIKAKEKRKLEIFALEHEEVMQMIKDAKRISQLPPNLTISTITSYLNGNTTIYSNDDRIKTEDLKDLTNLLLDGYKWEDEVIKKEIKKITDEKYKEKSDAFELLYKKFKNLPKTYYLVEEIESSLIRQQEFIGHSSSNVNVYFIPNNKSPLDAGRFYNCYINRVNNLNLEEILPLDLDSIITPGMDVDSIEWYVQEHADPTFKIAGGIILNKDETIGNVNVFKPNDGKIGINKDEKEKLDKIDSLDKLINEKEKHLKELESNIKKKQQDSFDIEKQMKNIISQYEHQALKLQMDLLKNIQNLKNSLSPTEENNNKINEEEKIRGL